MNRLVHGTAVAIGDCGVLIRGRPGSGKSSLGLQLIDRPGYGLGDHEMRGCLIADDQVVVAESGVNLLLSPPPTIAGLLEIRSIGIVTVRHISNIVLSLIVDLMPWSEISRMPDVKELFTTFEGHHIQHLFVDAFDPAAPSRIRAYLALKAASI
jgi:HPr kinase/phosphorylase